MDKNVSVKALAKELYLKGFSLEKIAEILNKNIRTVKNYKSSDGDWDEIKTSSYINSASSDKANIYQSFIDEMRLAIKEIREDEKLSSKDKANALSKIGDSFSKMSRVASLENPKAYKLSIARKVISLIVERFKNDENKECIKKLVELIESAKFIKAIEEMEAL